MSNPRSSMNCPQNKTLTVREACDHGWCRICKNPCFDPVDFAEFAGKNGVNAVIVKTKELTAFRLAPMPNKKFKELLKKYIEKKMEVK